MPWGDLLDHNNQPLYQRHVISVEPCLKGLMSLLSNLAAQRKAAERHGGAGGAVPVGQAMAGAGRAPRPPVTTPTALVVANPMCVAHYQQLRPKETEQELDARREDKARTSNVLLFYAFLGSTRVCGRCKVVPIES